MNLKPNMYQHVHTVLGIAGLFCVILAGSTLISLFNGWMMMALLVQALFIFLTAYRFNKIVVTHPEGMTITKRQILILFAPLLGGLAVQLLFSPSGFASFIGNTFSLAMKFAIIAGVLVAIVGIGILLLVIFPSAGVAVTSRSKKKTKWYDDPYEGMSIQRRVYEEALANGDYAEAEAMRDEMMIKENRGDRQWAERIEYSDYDGADDIDRRRGY